MLRSISLFYATALFALTLLFPSWALATPAAAKFEPADTIGVMHLDVDALRKTPFFSELQTEVAKNAEASDALDKMKAEWGFDPWKDIAGATVFIGPEVTTNDKDIVAVVEAKISEAKVLAHLESRSKSHPIEKRSAPSGAYYLVDGGEVAFAFRGKHVVVGGAARVLLALDAEKAKRRVGAAASKLASMRKKVERDAVWLAIDATPAMQRQLGMMSADSVEAMALGIQLDRGAKIQLHAHFADAQQAGALHRLLKEALAQGANDPQVRQFGLAEALKSMIVTLSGKDLSVRLALSQKQLDAIRDAVMPFVR